MIFLEWLFNELTLVGVFELIFILLFILLTLVKQVYKQLLKLLIQDTLVYL